MHTVRTRSDSHSGSSIDKATGPHDFVGDLPHGFTLWTHTTTGGAVIDEVYGNPGGTYRSAKGFAIHIGELLAVNNARDVNIRAQIEAQNLADARSAVIDHNRDTVNAFPTTGVLPAFKNPNDPDVVEYARTIGFVPCDADAVVLADRRNHRTIPAVPCNCTLR